MKKYIALLLFGFLFSAFVSAQSVSGNFSALKNQEIRLEGFNGMSTYRIATVQTDDNGNFELKYNPTDYGMGYLTTKTSKPYILILSKEPTRLKGEDLRVVQSIETLEGKENQLFARYAEEHPKREQALSGWDYLEKIYKNDTFFSAQSKTLKEIQGEKNRIKKEDNDFLISLPAGSYVKWFLPVRKLVSSVGVVAQYRPEEIPATLEAFRKIDYSDSRLYKSGLYKDVFESQVWFVENSSGELDKVFADLNKNIAIILPQISKDKAKFNLTVSHLFDFLESRSLFTSAEYLAIQALNDYRNKLEYSLEQKLEVYGRLKVGNPAPEIVFGEYSYYPEGEKATRLSEVKANYTLVYFAAGWCPHCVEETPKLAEAFKDWKDKGVKIVLVSLDETPADFAQFTAALPFISTTDFKKWDGKSVQDYAVNGTPTLYILDKDKKIVLKPRNTEHAKAWLKNRL